MKFGFLGKTLLLTGFVLCVFPVQASKDKEKAAEALRTFVDTMAKVSNETFARPKIYCQQLYGSNPDLTPLIEHGNDTTFEVCFVQRHGDKENCLVNTLPLGKDCVYYAARAQQAEIKLVSELVQCQTTNSRMVIHGAAQTVGSIVTLGLIGRSLPTVVGNLAVLPCLYSAGVGVEKMVHGIWYREYLQRRLKNNAELKNILVDKDCIEKMKAHVGIGAWRKKTEEVFNAHN